MLVGEFGSVTTKQRNYTRLNPLSLDKFENIMMLGGYNPPTLKVFYKRSQYLKEQMCPSRVNALESPILQIPMVFLLK